MAKERADCSHDLLPYHKTFRHFRDVKYNFSSERISYRKRRRALSVSGPASGAKVRHTALQLCPSMPTDQDPSNFMDYVHESNISSQTEVGGVEHSEAPDLSLLENEARNHSSMDINVLMTYCLLLKDENAYSCCDYSHTSFVLQDFDEPNKRLKRNKYIIVRRRGIEFLDVCDWIYWCSCDNKMSSLKSMNSTVNVKMEEFNAANCIHIDATKMFVRSYDERNELFPSNFLHDPNTPLVHAEFKTQLDGFFSIGGNGIICIYLIADDDPYGIVAVVCNKLQCLLCNYECKHVAYIESYLESENPPEVLEQMISILNAPSTGTKSVSPMGISWRKSAFELPEHIKSILRDGVLQSFQCNAEGDVILLCESDKKLCTSCKSELGYEDEKLPLITEQRIFTAIGKKLQSLEYYIIENNYYDHTSVRRLKCINCGLLHHFDGYESGMLNMGVCVVSYGVLRSYMHHFLNARCPMYTYYKIMVAMQQDAGENNLRSKFPYHLFKASWYHYLSILDIDYENGFKCPNCTVDGNPPDIIICDATSLAFRRDLQEGPDFDVPSQGYVLDGSSIGDRVFIDDQACRSLLSKYAKTATCNHELRDFLDSDADELVTMLNAFCPSLANLLIHFDKNIPCPGACSELLTALSSCSPVCALILPTPTIIRLVQSICEGVEIRKLPSEWKLLHENVPIIYRLICNHNETSLPPEYRQVVNEMLLKAQLPFLKTEKHSLIPVSTSVLENHYEYFPSLEKYCSRPTYVSDKRRENYVCSKSYKGHPSLLPGIFTLFCPHGICYGFEIMVSYESPNVPFTIFLTRFKQAPKVIVYDNACGLHTYCLKRDPHFFKETRFLVDRFHWSNHTACSMGYNLNNYPSLSNLNSEVNEQANSGLSKLKSHLSYMKHLNFINHCKLYLWNMNYRRLSSLV